jgi:hypothetical protein
MNRSISHIYPSLAVSKKSNAIFKRYYIFDSENSSIASTYYTSHHYIEKSK